jgi:capsular polysaccharide biosynthesis protein
LQQTYSGLLQKREDSKLAANLERREIGEQFKILDPASLPELPHNQKQRLAVLLGGPLGGLVLGLLLVGFLEYRDSSFKSEEDVSRALSLPVLGLIPVMDTDHDGRLAHRRKQRRAIGPRWKVS